MKLSFLCSRLNITAAAAAPFIDHHTWQRQPLLRLLTSTITGYRLDGQPHSNLDHPRAAAAAGEDFDLSLLSLIAVPKRKMAGVEPLKKIQLHPCRPKLPKGKTVAVVVLDGWGEANPDKYNCIHVADTPTMDSLKNFVMKRSLVPPKAKAVVSGGTGREDLEKLLLQHFGYSEFRGKQLEAIQAVLAGRDCFCLMPTGGGKSMCYQIPAIAKPGIVLVVSPLIALMEDQVMALKKKGIPAEFLSSTQTAHIKEMIHEDLKSGKPSVRLLYVTPELIATFGFLAKLTELYNRGLLSLIAIDEAHCVSTWGHDFRPSYRKLSSLRNRLPDVPILALTATAVPKVQKDVMESLCLQDPLILKASFNRPNIFYEVRYKDLIGDVHDDLSNLLKSSGSVCAIVYCLERSICDDLSTRLLKNGISSAAYHAGLNNKVRSAVLNDWLSSRTQVVVATVAFGMGIDRKDVHIVCNFNIPKSMEAFYQESGRAGRDQLPSRSVLYYGLDDRKKMEFILRNAVSKNSRSSTSLESPPEKSLEKFNQMVEYSEGSSCRRKKILESFGEQVNSSFCKKTCDACKHSNLVSKNLEELRHVPGSHKKGGLAPVFIKSSMNATFEDPGSEFWHRDDEDSFLDEDMSDSDDGAEGICDFVRSKMSSKAGLHEKYEVLERAEELFYQKEGHKKQGSSLHDKKAVTEALREMSKKRLLNTLNQAQQRLGKLLCNVEESTSFLEMECFKKYGKLGKTFYNSQLAATVRWLTSSSYEQIHDRLNTNTSSERCITSSLPDGRDASLPNPSDQDRVQAETTNEEPQDNLHIELSIGSAEINIHSEEVELPPIPSFSEFIGHKGHKTSPCQHSSGVVHKRAVDSNMHARNNEGKRRRKQ